MAEGRDVSSTSSKMIFVVFLLAGLANILGSDVPTYEGLIVGGKPTTIDEHPHQVSIRMSGSHNCGGVILSSNYIVTAAHCVKNPTAVLYSVRAGSSDRGQGGTLHQVDAVFSYPFYSSAKHDGDVAVLRLKDPISFGPKSQRIALVAEGKEVQHGEMLTVTGWGVTDTGSTSTLQVVRVPTISREMCRSVYKPTNITHYMVCAGVSRKDSCQGDSGGPLINDKHELVGIVSWGRGCGTPGYPGVYANVADPDMRRFIVEKIQG